MAKKRKAIEERRALRTANTIERTLEETFADSEDEFYTGCEKIFLDEAPLLKRRRKMEDQERNLQSSDEEVLEHYDESEEEAGNLSDTPEDSIEAATNPDDEAEYWGTAKEDYYNADMIETEADAVEEEAEARRLHQKQLKAMTEADFGFEEMNWISKEEDTVRVTSSIEKLPSVEISEHASIEERISTLRSRYPEFFPLVNEFINLQQSYQELKKEIMNQSNISQGINDGTSIFILDIRCRSLSAYLAAIAMYIVVLSSSKDGNALAPAELREHPVMQSILRCRLLWDSVKDIKDEAGNKQTVEVKPLIKAEEATASTKSKVTKGISEPTIRSAPSSKTSPQALKAQTIAAKSQQVLPMKRTRKSRNAELQDLLAKVGSSNETKAASDFGDEKPLTVEEAAEKAKKKKSLRFYTSQIAQKANKRGAASRDAGGDDDLPHKERLRDKQMRLMREAEQRGNKENGAKDFMEESDGESVGHVINNEANEYYEMMVSNSKQKQADKRARAEAYAEATKQGLQVYEEEQVGADGKRRITYAIEKNKGLAPKRKKDVRNPRVKKRKKYDEKMKKLGSIRQVYKGGESRGGYGGELTGIKTHVVKSIKL